MRFLVHAAGAVGGYFGALLRHGGHDVTFVARGANLEAIRQRGLDIHRSDGVLHVAPIEAVADPAQAARPDVVLVCVKSYDTPAAATALRPVVGPDTIVLSLQNGVENEDILARALGVAPLMIGLTRIGVELTGPGQIAYSGRGEIVFGEPDGRTSERARRLAGALETAGVAHRVRNDILVAAWEKLSWNAAFNAVTTLTGATVAEALGLPATRELIVRAMDEVDAVATALGIRVDRVRIEPVLAESARDLPSFHTSMLQDLRRGRRLEHDAISGAVVRAATRTGVSIPVNRTLAALLARLDPVA